MLDVQFRRLTVGSLFAGIGGFDLGLEATGGFTTKWQVEIDPYCNRILQQHWPTVRRYGDIRTVDWGTVEPVDLLCGGFPCQDLSFAGKRAGIDGERSGLWSEYLRAIRALRPRYVIVENVPGLLTNAYMGRVLKDLAESGYDAEWDCIPASAVGAPHRRNRVWIIAYIPDTQSKRTQGGIFQPRGSSQLGEDGLAQSLADSNSQRKLQPKGMQQDERGRISNGSEDVADPNCGRFQQREPQSEPKAGLSVEGERCGTEDVADPQGPRAGDERKNIWPTRDEIRASDNASGTGSGNDRFVHRQIVADSHGSGCSPEQHTSSRTTTNRRRQGNTQPSSPTETSRSGGQLAEANDVADPDTGFSNRENAEIQSRGHAVTTGGADVSDPNNTSSARQRKHSRQILPIAKPAGFDGGSSENWRAVKSTMGVGTDGLSPKLDGGEINGQTEENRSSQAVHEVQNVTDEENDQRKAGGSRHLSQSKILQSAVHGTRLCQRCALVHGHISLEGQEAPWDELRILWGDGDTTLRPSHRRERTEQFIRQYPNLMQQLSQHASPPCSTCWTDGSWEDGIPRVAINIPNRVNRLKGLGNAIVPQIAEALGRMILKHDATQL